jgi:WD40 repeat protein
MWSIPDGGLYKTIYDCSTYALTPDGTLLATGRRSDFHIDIWSVPDGILQASLAGSTSEIVKLAFSPDGGLLASSHQDNLIRLWSMPEGVLVKTLEGHTDVPLSLVFSPNGSLLASGGQDRTIKLWSLPDGELVGCPHI